MINGIVQITGEPGVGKTSFALQCGVQPERILFVDDDVKGRSTVNDLQSLGLKFGDYWDLIEMGQGKDEYELFQIVSKKIESIKKNQFDVLIWDTWTNFAASISSEVEMHPNKYRKIYSNSPRFAAMQRKGSVARSVETRLLGHLAKMIPTIFLITHLRPSYIENAPVPGKMEPASSPVLVTVPKTRFWLRRNPSGSPVPIALTLKGVSKIEVSKKGIRNVNVLPLKITPQDSEQSLWDSINRYWGNPIGDREPIEHEMPTKEELAIIGGMMTDDQKRIFEELVKSGLVGKDDGSEITNTGVDSALIKSMIDEGKPLPLIAKDLGIDLSQVKEITG